MRFRGADSISRTETLVVLSARTTDTRFDFISPALTADRRLYCMGNGADGRLGTGVSAAATFLPRLLSDITP